MIRGWFVRCFASWLLVRGNLLSFKDGSGLWRLLLASGQLAHSDGTLLVRVNDSQ